MEILSATPPESSVYMGGGFETLFGMSILRTHNLPKTTIKTSVFFKQVGVGDLVEMLAWKRFNDKIPELAAKTSRIEKNQDDTVEHITFTWYITTVDED